MNRDSVRVGSPGSYSDDSVMLGLDFSDFPLEIIRVTILQWGGHYFLDHRNEVMERTHRREWRCIRGAQAATDGSQQKSFLDDTKRHSSTVKLQSQTSVLAAHAAKGPWCVAIEFQDLINVRLDA